MPQIRTVDLIDARSRLRGRTTGSDGRAAYREAIAKMTDARMIELEPDPGESMRGLNVNVTRAAKEVNRDVGYGMSDTGTLLVWLESPKQRRKRRGKVASAG